jgi:hypothetical protein
MGWLDSAGKTHEKVYDVAWSDGRKPGVDGKLPAVGNTVDIASATWTNTIGASELAAVWTDPDFNSTGSAFYYARVLEIPTPPWYAYDAFRFGIEIPKNAPTSQQERAYTSPIIDYTQAVIDDDWPAPANDEFGQRTGDLKMQLREAVMNSDPFQGDISVAPTAFEYLVETLQSEIR